MTILWKGKTKKIFFFCNHVSGYSYENNTDKHHPESARDFEYLKDLLLFLFGDVMAMEVNCSISQQMEYRKYILEKNLN